MIDNFSKSRRIPLLSQEELNELGRVMHTNDKEFEKKYWENLYEKRGLFYVNENELAEKFDELISVDKIHVSLVNGLTIADLSNDEKIQLMRALDEIEIWKDKK